MDTVVSEAMGRRAFSSMMWLMAQRWGTRISGLLTLAILARMLEPADFGLVAAAMMFVPMMSLLTDLGFTEFLVQATHADKRMMSTAWWINLAFGTAIGCVFWGASPWIASAYNLPDLEPVLKAFALVPLVAALSGVPAAVLRRQLRFRAIAMVGFIATLSGQAAALALTFGGAGVWALVGQALLSTTVQLAGWWIASGWWPSLSFGRRDASDMVSFGIRVVAADAFGIFRGWAESTIIVSTLGVSALGVWNIAQRLVLTLTDASAAAVVTVSASFFAQVKTVKERLTRGYLRSLGATMSVVVPLMLLLAVASPKLVPIMFGSAWGEAIAVSQVLAVAAIFVLGANLDRGLMMGSGAPGAWLVYAVVVDVATVGVTAALAPHGLDWISCGFLVVALLAALARSLLVGRVTLCTPGMIGRLVAPVFLCGVLSAMLAVIVGVQTAMLPPVVSLVLMACVMGGVYLVGMRLGAPRLLSDLASVLPSSVRTLRVTSWVLG